MRKGLLGSIAALAAGAGSAWAQPGVGPGGLGGPTGGPGAVPGPAAVAPIAPGPIAPPPPSGGPPSFGGFPSNAIPGNAGFAPAPLIMPPGNFGPAYDPLGMGPVGGFGPPPGPMYPVPGPYAQQSWQPPPPMPHMLGPADPDSFDGQGGGRGGLGKRLLGRDLGYGAAPHVWAQGEYLVWFTKGQPRPYPLLTTSSPADAGLPGAASTISLANDRELSYNAINGFRLSGGFFGDEDRRFGFQMTLFVMERAANITTFGSLGNVSGIPVLARPYIDLNTGLPSSVVLSRPDFGVARAEVGTNTDMWGIEPAGIWNLYRSHPGERRVWSLDFIAGYRYIRLKEELWVHSRTELDALTALPQFVNGPFGQVFPLPATVGPAQTTFGGVNVNGPAIIEIRDRFTTINSFNGLVIGLKGEARYGMVTTTLFGKVAVGNMHERVDIFGGGAFFDRTGRSGTAAGTFGGFNTNVGGGVGAAYGGVLANAGNIGTFTQDRFTYIPEGGGHIGIALTRGLTGYIGANFIYFPDVVRPGDFANPVVSSNAIPFSASYNTPGLLRSPGVRFVQRDHWIGGAYVGLMLRY